MGDLMQPLLLRNTEHPDSAAIGEYLGIGGYGGLEKALEMSPVEVVEEVTKSNLLGRGGAGFPTGRKWEFAVRAIGSPKYLICNADEGEPGTFKDRVLMEKNPHLLIEGMVIASHAVGAEKGYIYLRHEYPTAGERLEHAINEAHEHGFLGDAVRGSSLSFDIEIFRGAGAYICGEETALIDSLEGRRGQPRTRPPFPVTAGLWGKPTIVNNVETLCNIPIILEIGGSAYADIGSPASPGPKLYCISGCVQRPGLYESPMGTGLRELIYDHAGGMRNGHELKAVIPGGLSTPILPADAIDCAMDFASLVEAGSALGSAGVIVMDDTVCMVQVARRAAQFYEVESCGKCVPCREGTGWLEKVLVRIESGDAGMDDLELIDHVSGAILGNCFCPLGDSAAEVVTAIVSHFRGEFEAHIRDGVCELDA
jgi:NADH-quinone oxidoreductase subunit F